MTQDQFVTQNPQEQFRAPEAQDSNRISHPGTTGEMDVEPDHGVVCFRGSGWLCG